MTRGPGASADLEHPDTGTRRMKCNPFRRLCKNGLISTALCVFVCVRVWGGWMCVFDPLRTFSAISTTLVRTSASCGELTVLMLQCIISDI